MILVADAEIAEYHRLRGQCVELNRRIRDNFYTHQTCSQMRAEVRGITARITKLHMSLFYAAADGGSSAARRVAAAHPTNDQLQSRPTRSTDA
jgi:hypothetical protein